MHGENTIQCIGYITQIAWYPKRTEAEIAEQQAELDAEFERKKLEEPDKKYRRKLAPKRSDFFLASLKCRNPSTQRWSDFWKIYCYGYMARRCWEHLKDGDRILVQGLPTIRIHKRMEGGLARLPQIWVKGVYIAVGGLQAELARKFDAQGKFTVDMVTDEEIGL